MFKIGGKIFTIVSLDDARICFKCSPEIFSELIEREDIRPAPYVGRYKWATLERLDAVAFSELRELIQQSYEMVAAKVPKKRSKRDAKNRNHARKRSKKSWLRMFSRAAHLDRP